MNKTKRKERNGKLFLLNANHELIKGDPKNYIPEHGIIRIADTFRQWKEVEKYSRIVTVAKVAKNDFNISPSRYVQTGAADEYRPIAEIVEELDSLAIDAAKTDAALKCILEKLAL